jgi:putative membrane protein
VTPTGAATDAPPTIDPVPWQRLDARMIAVDSVRLVGALIPLAIAVALRNADAGAVVSTLRTLAFIGAATALLDLWRWSTTWYRVTAARVEVRTGLVSRRHRSMPRDRIRRVDATAKVLHRVFGLAVVTIASGEQSGATDDLKLDAVTTRRAAELRHRLLGAPTAAGTPPAGAPGRSTWVEAAPGAAGDETVLASLRWRWAPYAVLSVWTLVLPALAVAAVVQALSSIGVSVEEVASDDRIIDRARELSPVAALALVVATVVLVGVAGALLRFVETWWGYRLVREPGGRLRIRRGLLTSRSISLDESRLRGVELAQPVLLRAAGGARLHAVTTGVGEGSGRGESAGALAPAAPIGEVERVAAAVLRDQRAPTDHADLRRHPRAALRRRLTRAALAVGVVALGLAAAEVGTTDESVPPGAWAAIPLVAAGSLAYARASYRSLGHALEDRYLVVRRGALVRRTVALRRTGIIGWTLRSTVFQRRLGLATVVATTAAGRGAYALVDVDADQGLKVAREAVPGLLDPFLTVAWPAPATTAGPDPASPAAHPGLRRRR